MSTSERTAISTSEEYDDQKRYHSGGGNGVNEDVKTDAEMFGVDSHDTARR